MAQNKPYKDYFSVKKVGAGKFFTKGSFSSQKRYGLAGALRAFKAEGYHTYAKNLSQEDLELFTNLIGEELKKYSPNATSISRKTRAKIMAKAEQLRRSGGISMEDKQDLRKILDAFAGQSGGQGSLRDKFYDDYDDDDHVIASGATASASARKQALTKTKDSADKHPPSHSATSPFNLSLGPTKSTDKTLGVDYSAGKLRAINRGRLREGLRPLTARQLDLLRSQVVTDIIDEIRMEESGKQSYNYDPRSVLGKRVKDDPQGLRWQRRDSRIGSGKSSSISHVEQNKPTQPLNTEPPDIDFGE